MDCYIDDLPSAYLLPVGSNPAEAEFQQA